MYADQYHIPKDRVNASGLLERATASDELVMQPVIITSKQQATHPNQLNDSALTQINNEDIADINEQILLHERLLLQMHEGHPHKPKHLADLGSWLATRFECLGDNCDEHQAIEFLECAVGMLDRNPAKAKYLYRLESLFYARFERLGVVADITKAISYGESAALVAPDDYPNKLLNLSNLGNYFLKRFDALCDVTDLHQSVSTHESVLRAMPIDHPERPMCLQKLANAYSKRWERLQDVADIDLAISNYADSLHTTPYHDKPPRHHFLGSTLIARFDIFGDVADLESAISHYEEALSISPHDYPHKSGFLHLLGTALLKRFKRIGNVADIHKSISNIEEAVRITTDEHPDRAAFLIDLGDSLSVRFENLGDIADLEMSISYARKVLSIIPNNHPDRHKHLSTLGELLCIRFKQLGYLIDINMSISIYEDILRITSGHCVRPGYLNDFGIALWTRFERLGDVADIDKGISCLEEALLHDVQPVKGRFLNTLGTLFWKRHVHSGDHSDIEKAILHHKAAARIIPDDDDNPGMFFNNLGNSLFTRFEGQGHLDDLESSISNLEMAKQLISDEHLTKADVYNNLGISLLKRFVRLGEIIDIDEAVANHQASLSLTPTSHPSQRRYLTNLGNAYFARAERLGDTLDIDNAISHLEIALRVTPKGHPEMASTLDTFGICFIKRYEMRSEVADLEKSIENQEAALRLTSSGHPEEFLRLSNLGIRLLTLFNLSGNIADIEKAFSVSEKAAELAPEQHPSTPGIRNNFGNVLFARFERQGDIDDLNKAISILQATADTMPDSHPLRSSSLSNLAFVLMQRFLNSHDLSDLLSSLLALRESSLAKTSPPSARFEAALLLSKIAHFYHTLPIHGFPSLNDAYATALDLLQRLAWLGLSINSRYQELLRANTVACDAAAGALMMDDPERALEWLEQGRSVVWGQMLQLRTPIDGLRNNHPDLADNLVRISIELEQGSSRSVNTTTAMDQPGSNEFIARKHRQLAHEWEKSVEKVQELPGFERFLLPKQYSQLRQAAAVGPIVVLNASTYRCDALILPSQEAPLCHIHLENFTFEQARGLQSLMRNILINEGLRGGDNSDRAETDPMQVHPDNKRTSRSGDPWDQILSRLGQSNSGDERHGQRVNTGITYDDEGFRILLAKLWNSVVKPVLDCLGLQPSSSQELGRIWWCGTGPFAFLPVHAAGLYPTVPTETSVSLADYAVSSYIPTLTSLLNSSRRPAHSTFKLVTIIQPNSPGASSLPGTEKELKCIQKHASRFTMRKLERREATVEKVLSCMKECSWVHFACHGMQDAVQPAKSALLLEDGQLELSEIIKQRLPYPDFAFLSACQTATGYVNHPDEAVHLAAGMLFAGYRGVVATMWSIRDSDAPFVTDEVYSQLLKDEHPNSAMAAQALHRAIQALRQKHSNGSFAAWVPFIHVGM
ncbi:hypothetical protein PILCRDRAFT_597497 [Piloderma croceum F 1598]|uniref:CHAT domain-containing protein n=1 Tax=Piloderma croceum (strain F 1598) TaxID=765440 RepID=A0A0C3FE42_PILCF|nr:hypothetical protein PILCRDRAFT_597497 [Piloderma croceum F 1598]